MKIYTTEELDEKEIPFPYIEKQSVWGQDIFLYVDNFRSEDWYGFKGWLRKTKDRNKAQHLMSNTHVGMHSRVKSGDVVFDCGANEGFTTVLLAKWVGPSGKVLAFEPDPKNIKIIEQNIKLNGLTNVTIIQKAISNVSGQKVSFGSEMIRGENTGLEVETCCLDDYKQYAPNFLKIDVEGYELPLLQGSKEILKTCGSMEIELHLSHTTGVHMKKAYGFNPDEIYKILLENNYDIKYQGNDVVMGEEPQGCVYCEKQAKKMGASGSVYKILVPSGIGDFSWMWSKLVTTEHRFHIHYIGGTPDRMRAFLSLLPKDRILSFQANSDYATKWDEQGNLVCFSRGAAPQIQRVQSLAEMKENKFYFIENNSWLESGKRIEEWNKAEIPGCDYHYDILGKLVRPERGNYFIVNFSSYGTKKAWGYYDVPVSVDIVETICKKTGWEAVFIGGSYDDYTQDIYTQLKARGASCTSLVGQTPNLIEVISLLQQSRMYFGACSGLMVISNNVYTPTVIYYPPFSKPPGRKLAGTWHDKNIPYLPLFWEGKEGDLCAVEGFLKNIK